MNTPEANENILQFQQIVDVPESWKSLPKSFSELYNGTPRVCVTYMCESEVPTSDELKKLVDAVHARGDVIALMTDPGYIVIPSFPEGQDPTVAEFLAGAFDASKVSKKAVLVVYAHVEEKK